METDGFYTAVEIADLMRTTRGAIYVAINEGKDGDTIPPSVKIGRKRLWKKSVVHRWFEEL